MIELITTRDGSHSLINHELEETYHSSHGAFTESMHVFIQEGLQAYCQQQAEPPETLNILEVGFGTGLNALLTWEFAHQKPQKVFYETLEPFPVPIETVKQLNYTANIESAQATQIFEQMHQAPWGQEVSIDERFILAKHQMKLEQFNQSKGVFDAVYFDAFAPKVQPELWSLACLQNCYDALKFGGILTTYCAQGQFKRDLRSIGFEVERVVGPPKGKREITRAWKREKL